MRVGHGVTHLDVIPGEPMGGYADRSHGVRDVLDPLEVHAVTFAEDGHRFALVVADLICVNADVVERVRRALHALEVDSCWVAATHSHATPEAGCVPGGGATPEHVADRLVSASVAATRAALAAEQVAWLQVARVGVRDLGGRRTAREPMAVEIPVDVVAVRTKKGVVGLIAVSPVHPTVLPADNDRVSADLSGGIRRQLSGGVPWAVVMTGAAGDISTRHTRRGRGFAEVDRLGALVADSVRRALVDEGGQGPAVMGRPVSRRIELRPKGAAETDGHRQDDAAIHEADERTRWVLQQGQILAAELAASRRTASYVIDLQAIDLGPVGLVAVPGELFLELGELIRTEARDAGRVVIVLGYTNGYLGYLPTRDAPACYETYASPVAASSGEIVTRAAVELAVQRSERSHV